MHARSPQYQVLNSRAVTGRRLQNKRARDASTRHPSQSNRKRPGAPCCRAGRQGGDARRAAHSKDASSGAMTAATTVACT
jgi:type IV secretory pathway TrbL component